jgi:hypothetical protein
MRPTHIWIIAGTVGALIGSAFTYYLADNNPPTSSLAGVSQTEPVSRDPKTIIPVASVSDKWTQDSIAAQRDGLSISGTKTEASSAAPPPTAGLKKPDPAEEEAMVQVISSRLYDPSMTLANIMQSEEMLKLSDETRERMVAKMVGMLNRGEIDARTFMSGGR